MMENSQCSRTALRLCPANSWTRRQDEASAGLGRRDGYMVLKLTASAAPDAPVLSATRCDREPEPDVPPESDAHLTSLAYHAGHGFLGVGVAGRAGARPRPLGPGVMRCPGVRLPGRQTPPPRTPPSWPSRRSPAV